MSSVIRSLSQHILKCYLTSRLLDSARKTVDCVSNKKHTFFISVITLQHVGLPWLGLALGREPKIEIGASSWTVWLEVDFASIY